MDTIYIVLIISVLGPVIGSLMGIIIKPSNKITYHMLSFAAGVMLSISFLELIPESLELTSVHMCALGIVIGTIVMYILDKFVPHTHPDETCDVNTCNLKRTAIYLVVGIFLHNIPEGMAIALGTITDSKVTLTIALAIAIHNIPEGICTSAPYYQSTGKRLKAFLISSSTSLPIIVGFFVAKILFQNITLNLVGIIVASTAGLMIYICSDELIPASSAKVTKHTTIFSLMAGILFVILLELV
jgi:ZIP family zinc transporter